MIELDTLRRIVGLGLLATAWACPGLLPFAAWWISTRPRPSKPETEA